MFCIRTGELLFQKHDYTLAMQLFNMCLFQGVRCGFKLAHWKNTTVCALQALECCHRVVRLGNSLTRFVFHTVNFCVHGEFIISYLPSTIEALKI